MTLITAFLVGGVAGWILENAIEPAGSSRYSHIAPKGVPFLPIYGFGAAFVVSIAPSLEKLSLPARGAVYAGSLTALEFVAGKVERNMLAQKSWDYEGSVIDPLHTIAWGVLGLAAEKVMT